ncbi:MAG: Crp/Fnr family transcriptional regulator [Gammaproteobacteria bacterium]
MNAQLKFSAVSDRRSLQPRALQPTCSGCTQRESCLPDTLAPPACARLTGAIRRLRSLRRGEHLYWPGATAEHVFVLRSGAVKSYILDPSGLEQITGFFAAGDWLGLEGFGSGVHASAVVALADTAVCAIPCAELDMLCASEPPLRRRLWRALAEMVQTSHRHALLLADKPTEQRLTSFLIELAERAQAAGHAGNTIELSMPRADIGNFLGMATETVSRWFTRLHRLGMIAIDGRRVTLADRVRLQRLAAGAEPYEAIHRRGSTTAINSSARVMRAHCN